MSQILCIFDGFGLAKKSQNNAIYLAKMPNFRSLLASSWWTTLDADGDMVGQEAGLVGNSEVGHMNLGGLKLVPQLSYQITSSSQNDFIPDNQIAPDQNFDPNKRLQEYKLQKPKAKLHLISLFSKGKVHSDTRHLMASIKIGLKNGYDKVYLHLFSDGRDSDRTSFWPTWQEFKQTLTEQNIDLNRVVIASIGGRFYGMDRDNNYDRVLTGLGVIFDSTVKTQVRTDLNLDYLEAGDLDNFNISKDLNITDFEYTELKSYFDQNYTQGIYDETIPPVSLSLNGLSNSAGIGDILWVQNFRSDRVRQLTKVLIEMNLELNLQLQILTNNEYAIPGLGSDLYSPVFQNKPVARPMAEVISKNQETQLHIAETEKYNHVTYFLNGGSDVRFTGEVWQIIPSNKVASHAQMPAMKAVEVTDYILEKGLDKFDKIIVNYANPDMVGHTGDLEATIQALEVLDQQLGRLMAECQKNNHTLILTADHGNAEIVGHIQAENRIDTEHNLNPVPCIIYNQNIQDIKTNLENLAQQYSIKDLPAGLAALDAQNQIDLSQQDTWLENIPKPTLGLHWAGIFFMALK